MATAMRTRLNIVRKPANSRRRSGGLKSAIIERLQITPERVEETQKNDTINFNAAKDSLTEEKRNNNHPNAIPNKDETLEEKAERAEQNPIENTESLQKANLRRFIRNQFQVQQNFNDLKKNEGIKFDDEQKNLLLNEAMNNPRSNDARDPMGLVKKAKEKDEKIIRIIMKQNLPAEQIQALLEKNVKSFEIDGLGKLKNKHRGYRESVLMKKIKKKQQIRNNIRKQKAFEKEHPKLFTTMKAERIKTELGGR